MKKRLFTLVELLIVISIIAILASMLLPALGKAKYRAKVTSCLNTLKGVTRVMTIYTSDYDDYYPEVASTYEGSGGYTDANLEGNRGRAWQWAGGKNNSGDLRPLYREYFGGSIEQHMKCSMTTTNFSIHPTKGTHRTADDLQISYYTLYPTSNYQSKLFHYRDVGGFQKIGTTWRSEKSPQYEFSLLASDPACGNTNPYGSGGIPTLTGHPSSGGAVKEYTSEINSFSAWLMGGPGGYGSPNNFANDDGSVRTYYVDGRSRYNTSDWVLHGSWDFLLPMDLAR